MSTPSGGGVRHQGHACNEVVSLKWGSWPWPCHVTLGGQARRWFGRGRLALHPVNLANENESRVSVCWQEMWYGNFNVNSKKLTVASIAYMLARNETFVRRECRKTMLKRCNDWLYTVVRQSINHSINQLTN